jgi:hypothetical protein
MEIELQAPVHGLSGVLTIGYCPHDKMDVQERRDEKQIADRQAFSRRQIIRFPDSPAHLRWRQLKNLAIMDIDTYLLIESIPFSPSP